MAARLLPETLRNRVSERFSVARLIRSYGGLLRHRPLLAYLGIITAGYGGLFAWISGAAVVLQDIYGMSAVTFGFTFALGAAGYMAGAAIAARLVVRLGLDRTMGIGVALIALGGLAFAAAVAAEIPGVWLVVMMALYFAGLGLAMPQAMAAALTPFPDRAGTAASLHRPVSANRRGGGRSRGRPLSRRLRVAGGRRRRRNGLHRVRDLDSDTTPARGLSARVPANWKSVVACRARLLG